MNWEIRSPGLFKFGLGLMIVCLLFTVILIIIGRLPQVQIGSVFVGLLGVAIVFFSLKKPPGTDGW